MGAPILSGFGLRWVHPYSVDVWVGWGGCTHTQWGFGLWSVQPYSVGVWTGVSAPILNGGWAEVGAPILSGCMGGLGCSAKHCKKGQDVSTVAMCPIKEV